MYVPIVVDPNVPSGHAYLLDTSQIHLEPFDPFKVNPDNEED